ncbi:DUF2249 domain-containing protein [Pontibacter arcticus]|uniref:DUF2249 domain-containing protein n=1 Tax=Pontibacter arcticus TaxID=2080288 RepID=A0A364RF86_9BACT|nr:DUF2249 domain-containing protein [Pontibacter arcticus]RAU82826.1 hypothetical protein DP923_06125 [Pontibacter arcticus]
MKIAAITKISALIKENPEAIDTIASINGHFEKLRNPLLRKVLASRVTIADAARIGGCDVELFFQKLAPLGFVVEGKFVHIPNQHAEAASIESPAYLKNLPESNLITLDVREAITEGKDPFTQIMSAVKEVTPGKALLLINTFEPTPLLEILKKKNFQYHLDTKSENLVYTYFWPENKTRSIAEPSLEGADTEFETGIARFAGKVKRIDVRHLEMPQPMVTILSELEDLAPDEALYVVHKRVPQFLLPQLQERGFQLNISEAGPDQVYLLIYT